MFESALEQALLEIFDLPKVSYSKPSGESREQNILFVDVIKAVPTAKPGQAKCRVTGELTLYAPFNKIPFGYFEKKLQKASAADTAPFYFYNMEENSKVTGDIVERKCSFIYFFATEYDPEHGSLTSVEF